MIANNGLQLDDKTAPLCQNVNGTLAQITLISQFERMMYDHAPSTSLSRVPSLPKLALPTLPTHLHRLVGRILAEHDDDFWTVRILSLIFERGYVVPPTVWLPSKRMRVAFDGINHEYLEGVLPSCYLSWCAWADGNQPSDDEMVLTAENWEDFSPAQRLERLRELRHHEPRLALELIAKFAPSESADRRFELVDVLMINLSDEDKPFLQSLKKDRSQKVQTLVKTLLSRLGEYDTEADALADELFGEFEFGVDGLVFKATKNEKQRQNRREQLAKVNLFALAQKFELTLPKLLLAWDFDGNERKGSYHPYNQIFVSRLLALLSDEEILGVIESLMKIIHRKNGEYWHFISGRLPLSYRQEYAHKRFLRGLNFADLLRIAPDTLDVGFGALQASRSWKNMVQHVQNAQAKHGMTHHHVHQLHALGLLVRQDVAKACLVALEEAGISKMDDALSMLTLNALLDPLEVGQ